MRITERENYVFVQVLSKYVAERSELHLFGDFVDETATDGSIELLLIVYADDLSDQLNAQRETIEREIEQQIEDDEVKLLISSEANAKHNVKIRDILPDSVFLYRW